VSVDTAGAATALSPPDVLPAPAPASVEAVVVLPVEPPVTADAEMAEVPLLEVGDWKPASLVEGVPDASTAGGPYVLEEGGAELSHPVLKVNRIRTMYVPGSVIHVHGDYINDSS
jgi:hypothetical protein